MEGFQGRLRVSIIPSGAVRSFESKVNEKIEELESQGHRIVDVRYQSSTSGGKSMELEHSVMILYEEIRDGDTGRRGRFDVQAALTLWGEAMDDDKDADLEDLLDIVLGAIRQRILRYNESSVTFRLYCREDGAIGEPAQPDRSFHLPRTDEATRMKLLNELRSRGFKPKRTSADMFVVNIY